MVLAIAAEYNLACWPLDYKTSFLNADVTEEIYVKMAPGYNQFDENGIPLVMRLLKSLYGLRQSPTNWWNTIDKVEIGLKNLKSDPCVHSYSECGAICILTPVCRRHSLARKRRPGAKADHAETHESFLNDEHGATCHSCSGWVLPVTARRGR